MDQPISSPPWSKEIGARLVCFWRLKFWGLTAFITLFFVGYFILLRSPVFPVTLMPITWLDRAIPFHPLALIAYLSLWLYVSLPISFMRDRRQIFAHAGAAGVMGVFGLTIFLLWPTAAPPAAALVDVNTLALSWLKQVDAAGNACPSLHVAFAVNAGIWLHWLLADLRAPRWVRGLNLVWCVAITYSTLATKQHVIVDVIAGGMLGGLAGVIGLRRILHAQTILRASTVPTFNQPTTPERIRSYSDETVD